MAGFRETILGRPESTTAYTPLGVMHPCTASLGDALVSAGHAVLYDGGTKKDWCR